jgi:O-antigen/teichoic acid export membrane protein
MGAPGPFRDLLSRLGAREGGGSLARGALLVLALQAAGIGLGYLLQVFLARWMDAPAYGAYTYAFAWASTAATAAGLGLPSAALRFLPAYQARGEWSRFRGFIRTSTALVLAAGLGLAALGAGVTLGFQGRYGTGTTLLLLLGAGCIPLLALHQLLAETFRAVRRVGLAYGTPLLLRLFIAAGAALLLLRHLPLTATRVLGVALIALLLLCALQLLLLRPSLPSDARRVVPTYSVRPWLRVALPLLLVALFALANSRVDVLLLGFFADASAVGIYNAGARTASLISLFLFAVNAVAAPAIAAVHAREGRAGLQHLVDTVTPWIFWPSLLAALGLFVFARPILGLFGPAFTEGVWVVRVLALGYLVDAGAGPVAYLLQLTGHQKASARVYGWCALLNLALNSLAIPLLGFVGAACATALTIAVRNLWLYALVLRTLQVHASIFSRFATPPS